MIEDKVQKNWAKNRINPGSYEKYLENGKDFINDRFIEKQLAENQSPDAGRVKDILDKSLAVETLTPAETACLLNVEDPELINKMEQAAARVKEKVYDNRIVTFAPLYLNNLCLNNCKYCGFRRDNKDVERKILSSEQIKKETEVLAGDIGHKRLIVVYGEAPATGIDYMVDSIKNIYNVKVDTKNGTGQIRRVNVNAPPLQTEELKQLKEVGIGTYQVFQETYHHDTYNRVHPDGTLKNDYRWRLYSMHRAFEAGIDDVGLGVLFGLYNWKFEVLALLAHARELENRFNVGPHTISFPRLEPAQGASLAEKPPHPVADDAFKKLVTVLRLAVPYTGLIITARENPGLRRKALRLGCTQADSSTRIGIGAYSNYHDPQAKKKQQFLLGDTRNLDEFVRDMAEMGNITSFCTAGYRCGRTGECIMELLREGKEADYCKLNAILTFREWLDDFASEAARRKGEKLLKQELQEVKRQQPEIYPRLKNYYKRISNGERDLYF